jgi:hypothetical protein
MRHLRQLRGYVLVVGRPPVRLARAAPDEHSAERAFAAHARAIAE